MNNENEIRKISLETLLEIQKNNTPSHILLRAVLDKYNYFSDLDKALISTIVKGVIERKIELDYIINQFSNTPVKKMKPVIRTILEMGVYQIVFMDVYDTAAVNTSVELAKKKGFKGLTGFVNAVLRSVAGNKENIVYPKEGSSSYLSVRYSVPEPIVDKIIGQYGYETAEKIFYGSIEKKSVSVRFSERTDGGRRREIKEELEKKKIVLTEYAGIDGVYKMTHSGNITEIPAFKSGEMTVQDASSVIMCRNVPKGRNIIDVCAAPGGKSAYLAELFPDSHITACDISADKLSGMNDGFIRMKLNNIEVRQADATVFIPEYEKKYDVVVADVPCSGLGVIGKKQDIKYRLSEEDFKALTEIQSKILENVSRYVADEGFLLYSTCTINREENIDMINEFVKNSDFEFDRLRYLPKEYESMAGEGYLELLQGVGETDGFFVAVLKKKNG